VSQTKPALGVIGLGIMGGAMAEALLAQAYDVVGYDVRADACQRLKNAGGRPLPSSTAVARRADVVITSLATVAALTMRRRKSPPRNDPIPGPA